MCTIMFYSLLILVLSRYMYVNHISQNTHNLCLIEFIDVIEFFERKTVKKFQILSQAKDI